MKVSGDEASLLDMGEYVLCSKGGKVPEVLSPLYLGLSSENINCGKDSLEPSQVSSMRVVGRRTASALPAAGFNRRSFPSRIGNDAFTKPGGGGGRSFSRENDTLSRRHSTVSQASIRQATASYPRFIFISIHPCRTAAAV
jgi:hypothetical protein